MSTHLRAGWTTRAIADLGRALDAAGAHCCLLTGDSVTAFVLVDFPSARGEVPDRLVDLCFGELRSYFNRRTVRAIVERSAPEGRSYARAAIDYCERAHFQAVADEYLYVGKNVLQRNTPGEMAEHLARVLGIGLGDPTST